MHVCFFECVRHFGGASIALVDFAARLKSHAEVSIVDFYGTCKPLRSAAAAAGVRLEVAMPLEHSKVISGDERAWVRAIRTLEALPHLMAVRTCAERALVALRPSVISSMHFKSAMMVACSPRLRHIPQVVYLHGWYTPDMLPWYGRWICRRAAAVLAVSHATKMALTCSGLDPRRIQVLHNSIDVDEMIELSLRPPTGPLPQLDRSVRILLPADLIRTKGQHTAIEALRYLLDSGQDAVLWLAGEHAWPYGDNRDYPRQLRTLADRLGVADRIEWLGRRNDLPHLMRAASVVVLPTHSEGHPLVVLEAMSLGKPVAVCPSGGVLDLVCENVTGLLFDVDDALGLADCILRYGKNPAWAERIGRQAQDYVRQSFQPEQQVQAALKALRAVDNCTRTRP
jgi:glycosyltransferase involved in cell wall biosynthesis